MNILFAASECTPFIKTGGLADVIGALPKALQDNGVGVSVILPMYGDIASIYKEQMNVVENIRVPVGWRHQYCGIEFIDSEGIRFYFLDNEYYFRRHGSYGFEDDGERFAFFSRAVLEVLPHLKDQPDVIHCHDWQTGLISVLLKAHYRNRPCYKDLKTAFSIHNLRYQGIYPRDVLRDLLDLDESYFHIDGLEFYGNVSYLKAGLAYSDTLTTVSPTYAAEIQTDYFGERLDGLLRKRKGELAGIVNGIDRQAYDPMTDQEIYTYYQDSNKRGENKRGLQEALGLSVNPETPLIAMITRLVDQKGIDLVLHVFRQMMEMGIQFVLLGTGDARYEQAFSELVEEYGEQRVSVNLFFDESLARKIYAGSDMFLMPSQFEPCGIGQLLAMRYGSLPIVRETGGLNDTVIPYNEFTDQGCGFTFSNYNAHDMLYTIERAVWFYVYQPKTWRKLVDRVMNLDFGWRASAERYKQLYERLVPKALEEKK